MRIDEGECVNLVGRWRDQLLRVQDAPKGYRECCKWSMENNSLRGIVVVVNVAEPETSVRHLPEPPYRIGITESRSASGVPGSRWSVAKAARYLK